MVTKENSAPWLNNYGHPSPWELDIPVLSVPEMFLASAAAWPDRPICDFYGRTFSYAAILSEARKFAAGLQKLGINKGDRVGLYLPNVPVYLSAYFGALLAGAIVVNFSPLYTADELSAQVNDSGTQLLVTIDSSALLPTALKVHGTTALQYLVAARLPDMLPFTHSLGLRFFRRNELTPIPESEGVFSWHDMLSNEAPIPVSIDPMHDLALLQYTGGTTGTPKGAMLTHYNLTACARQNQEVDPHKVDRDVIIGLLPLFHIFANGTVLNRTVLSGGCIAMLPRFNAAQCLKLIERTKATSMPGVPTMFQALIDHPDCAKTDFRSLQVCISGGAPLAPQLKERFESVTGANLVEGYGLTETSGTTTVNLLNGSGPSNSIGQPTARTELRLIDKDDPSRNAPRGEPGELVVKGPQVMQGYWNRPVAGNDVFIDGWLRTGDVATIDEQGFVRIVDRIKDMIAVGGFKVFPSQVEAVLREHDAVKEALVIGVPDSYRGEKPRAYVTLMPNADVTGQLLMAWLNERLGKHERVDAVIVREELPKTIVGKLDRKALRIEVEAAG